MLCQQFFPSLKASQPGLSFSHSKRINTCIWYSHAGVCMCVCMCVCVRVYLTVCRCCVCVRTPIMTIINKTFSSFRILWLVTVLAMKVTASYMIVNKFLYFYQYPTETKTTITNQNELDFPSVTICNLNKFRSHQIKNKKNNNVHKINCNKGILHLLKPFV